MSPARLRMCPVPFGVSSARCTNADIGKRFFCVRTPINRRSCGRFQKNDGRLQNRGRSSVLKAATARRRPCSVPAKSRGSLKRNRSRNKLHVYVIARLTCASPPSLAVLSSSRATGPNGWPPGAGAFHRRRAFTYPETPSLRCTRGTTVERDCWPFSRTAIFRRFSGQYPRASAVGRR